LVGDIPIYVDMHSADVWDHQSLFRLDATGRPTHVSGVPPDYFSETGQLWGNPLYRWDVLESRQYSWWVRRFRRVYHLFDIVRVDHFRGFEAYWEVPVEAPTAQAGKWVAGPGIALFDAVRRELGPLNIIAEDLGVITDAVRTLRDQLGFPGMKILQFAFDSGPKNPYLPENHEKRSVVYPGTHDNDTTAGWYATLGKAHREQVDEYLGASPEDPAWTLIELAWHSPANLALATLQDVLSLGSQARMNLPGVADGNWRWRARQEAVTSHHSRQLAALTHGTGR
jgi:4-alpha-glucanotransferase